jgi:hypothetical protein
MPKINMNEIIMAQVKMVKKGHLRRVEYLDSINHVIPHQKE